MNKVNKQNYISTAEAAKILKISRIAVFKKIKSGQLDAKKFGRNYLIDREELQRLGDPSIKNLPATNQKIIEEAVTRTIKQYGETLRLLGREEG